MHCRGCRGEWRACADIMRTALSDRGLYFVCSLAFATCGGSTPVREHPRARGPVREQPRAGGTCGRGFARCGGSTTCVLRAVGGAQLCSARKRLLPDVQKQIQTFLKKLEYASTEPNSRCLNRTEPNKENIDEPMLQPNRTEPNRTAEPVLPAAVSRGVVSLGGGGTPKGARLSYLPRGLVLFPNPYTSLE